MITTSIAQSASGGNLVLSEQRSYGFFALQGWHTALMEVKFGVEESTMFTGLLYTFY